MLCRVATRVNNTLDQALGSDADKRDMGVTTEPKGASPPRLNLNVHKESPNDWKVKCILTPAIEGTNRAVYLGPGTYPTGLAWWPESNAYGSTNANHSEIYAILDATNSDRSRRAELEHCNDWLRAHVLTLKAAENTIRHATPGVENRRFDSRLAAYQGALEAFVAHSPHPRIAAVFQRSFIALGGSGDFFPQWFTDGLKTLFFDVGNQTASRDQLRWHHFEYSNTIPNNQLGWMDYFQANGRDYRRVQPSARFSVGVTSSNQLIQL
jgi:hypothetical protein